MRVGAELLERLVDALGIWRGDRAYRQQLERAVPAGGWRWPELLRSELLQAHPRIVVLDRAVGLPSQLADLRRAALDAGIDVEGVHLDELWPSFVALRHEGRELRFPGAGVPRVRAPAPDAVAEGFAHVLPTDWALVTPPRTTLRVKEVVVVLVPAASLEELRPFVPVERVETVSESK